MAKGNYINLERKITKWKWYKKPNTFRVFIHLLLNANWKDTKYEGEVVPRGSLATTIEDLSEDLDITYQQSRTALSHLKSTREITITRKSKYLIITIQNYSKYQYVNNQINNQITITSQKSTITEGDATLFNIKNIKKDIYVGAQNTTSTIKSSKFIKPTVEEIQSYIDEKSYNIDAEKFFDHYESVGWMVGRNHMKDWKACVRNWNRRQYPQTPQQQSFVVERPSYTKKPKEDKELSDEEKENIERMKEYLKKGD